MSQIHVKSIVFMLLDFQIWVRVHGITLAGSIGCSNRRIAVAVKPKIKVRLQCGKAILTQPQNAMRYDNAIICAESSETVS